MPELPEVEMTLRIIAPHLEGKRVIGAIPRTTALRYPLEKELAEELPGVLILRVERRGKYLLLRATKGCLIIHLGMSGSLRVTPSFSLPERHDRLDILLAGGTTLRFNDPRRFGLAIWTKADPLDHPLLRSLGPEPLGKGFNGEYLFEKSRGRSLKVKQFIMNNRVIPGIGNIYANEALFLAGVNPAVRAGELSLAMCRRLAAAIVDVLTRAMARGEMTLADSQAETSKAVYFPLDADVYGKKDEPCPKCGETIRMCRLSGRSTYFCPRCQG